MVLGLGIDLVEIDRIKASIEKYNTSFLHKIFTDKEIEYCDKKANKYQHYAARFAAKEAVSKAIGTGWDHKFKWKDVEVINKDSGEPELILGGELQNLYRKGQIKISITHSHNYAACVAIFYSVEQAAGISA